MKNPHPREQEAAVAREMTNSLVTQCVTVNEIVPQDVLAHHFGMACNKLSFIADEVSWNRIWKTVSRELRERKLLVDLMNDEVVRSTEASLQMQCDTKKATGSLAKGN